MSQLNVPIFKWNRIRQEFNKGFSYKRISKRHDINEDSIRKFIDTVTNNEEIRKRRLKKQRVWIHFQYIFKTKGKINKNWVRCKLCKLVWRFKSAKNKMEAYLHHELEIKLVNSMSK